MNTCAIKRGFFVLRECGGPAAVSCLSCQRPVCPEHFVRLPPPQQGVQCLECRARQGSGEGDDDDPYSLRHRYYVGGYRPIYLGDPDPYYDDYDFRGFAEDADNPDDADLSDDGEPGATFGDS